MNNNVMGMIITYNPNIELLKKNISAIRSQIDFLLIYDNNSQNISEIEELKKIFEFSLLKFTENLGVAKHLKSGIEYAYNKNFEYILTLDQDSVACNDMVAKLKLNFVDEKVAMVGPSYIQVKYQSFIEKKEYQSVPYLITSGALSKVKCLYSAGNYNEDLFIYWVDNDICYKLRDKGFTILQRQDVYLEHNMGSVEKKRILFKNFYINNYNPFALYYRCRNFWYCKNYHPKFYNEFRYFRKTISKELVKILFFEKNKVKKIKAIFSGNKDGKKDFK